MSLIQQVFRRDPLPLIIMVGASLIAWGMAMALSGALYLNPTYNFLSAFGNGVIVGSLATALGGGLVAAVLLGMRVLTRILCAIAAVAWLSLSAGILAGGFPGAATWTYGVVGVSGLWGYLALGVRHNGQRG